MDLIVALLRSHDKKGLTQPAKTFRLFEGMGGGLDLGLDMGGAIACYHISILFFLCADGYQNDPGF